MRIEDVLEVFLITYNRKKNLEKTLKSILDTSSPISKCQITVLNNFSTDGTDDVIEEYVSKYKNVKHLRRNRNVGADGNTCLAYELASKEYLWVLCDDDKYDWTDWPKVEKAIIEKKASIMVSHYKIDNFDIHDKAYQLLYLTYVPGHILRTEYITDTIMSNMYNSIYTLFPQLILPIWFVNNKIDIYPIEHPLVIDDRDDSTDGSFIRGAVSNEVTIRRRYNQFLYGYAAQLQNVNDKKLAYKALKLHTNMFCPGDKLLFKIKDDMNRTKMFNLYAEVYMLLKSNEQDKLSNIKNIFQIYYTTSENRIRGYLRLLNKFTFKIFSLKRID